MPAPTETTPPPPPSNQRWIQDGELVEKDTDGIVYSVKDNLVKADSKEVENSLNQINNLPLDSDDEEEEQNVENDEATEEDNTFQEYEENIVLNQNTTPPTIPEEDFDVSSDNEDNYNDEYDELFNDIVGDEEN